MFKETLINMFRNSVQQRICEAISEQQEEFIVKAVKDYESKLRSRIGGIVIDVNQWYRMEVQGNELIIRVIMEGQKS